MKKDEKYLQDFLEKLFVFWNGELGPNDLGVCLIEHGSGGTEGLPDVLFPFEGRKIEIELKDFRGKPFQLRPMQYSYHHRSNASEYPTFVFGLFSFYKTEIEFVCIIKGHDVRSLHKRSFGLFDDANEVNRLNDIYCKSALVFEKEDVDHFKRVVETDEDSDCFPIANLFQTLFRSIL
mgnify:FL=1